MEKADRKMYPLFILIFAASLSSLSYEIALIRIFSVSLWYHFAFMVISIAMLGIGASGTLLSVFPKWKDVRSIPLYGLLLCVGIPLSYLLANAVPFDPARLSWDRAQLLYVSLYYIVLSFPFFCFGLIVSTAYSAMTGHTARIYASDLVGAGAGSLATFWLLYAGGPENIVFIVSSLMAFVLLLLGDKKIRVRALLLVVMNAALFFISPQLTQPRISPYKPMELALKFLDAKHLRTRYSPYSRVDVFKSPAVRFAPGLSFRYLESLPEQTGISVDAGDVSAMTSEGEKEKLEFIRYLPSGLPYLLSRGDDVLILEPRAGLAVLTARQYGAKNIYTVDSNPLVIKTVREYAPNLSSRIYGENTWPGLGRSWLAARDKEFDVIDISFMGSMPMGSFGFAEDYRFTVEAFQEYMEYLKPEGFLSLSLYILPPPRTELRLLATMAEAAEKIRLKNFPVHVAAIRSWGTLTMIMKKSPLSFDDIRKIKKFSREMRFDLVYYPGITEEESNRYVKMPGNEYFHAFERLMNPTARHQLIRDYLFDIQPVHDENPFFHYYLKLKNTRDIYRVMGEKWQYFMEEGYLLPVLFVQVVLLGFFLILLPVIRVKRQDTFPLNPNLILSLSYFACLGIGFLFVEISFIQKMILALENPPYAVSTVIASILISSGMGSLLSQRMEKLRKPGILLVLAGMVLIYSLSLSVIIHTIGHYPLPMKIILVFFLLMPVGMLMGIPFPLGLSLLGRTSPALIPWAWAINGCFSVLAPILAVMLALSAGFRTVIFMGAIMYFAAFLALKRTLKGAAASTRNFL